MDTPQILDKGCYWLICMPIPADAMKVRWSVTIWRKGDDHAFTHKFAKQIAHGEEWAAELMDCEASAESAAD